MILADLNLPRANFKGKRSLYRLLNVLVRRLKTCFLRAALLLGGKLRYWDRHFNDRTECVSSPHASSLQRIETL